MRRVTIRQLTITLLGLAALATAWSLLAPGALGGSTSYVVTHGSSMAPRLKAGDLVLVRRQSTYRVGEIVAYESKQLQTIVLHRIVARKGSRYVFKGDHNQWLDSERPTRDQLLGASFLRIPGLGGKLKQAGTPIVLALLLGTGALLLGGGTGAARSRRRRRRRADSATATARRPRPAGPGAHTLLAGAASALLVFLLLGAIAFTRPIEAQVSSAARLRQAGAFSYSALAPMGDVYPDGRVKRGDTIFVRLVDRLRVRFDYELSAPSPEQTTGTATLLGELASSSGWKRRLELQPPRRFTGDRARMTGTLALAPLESLLKRIETATGGDAIPSYTLTLVARVRVHGRVAGSPLATGFAPRLSFALDRFQLRPLLAGASAQGGSAPLAGQAANPFRPSSSGSVSIVKRSAHTLSLRWFRASVARARRTAVVGALAALGALLVAALLVLRGRRADEPSRIQARYRRLLIPVGRSERRSSDEVVEVRSIQALVQLAERYDRMILHEQSERGHAYRIADDGILYVYLIRSPDSEEAPALAATAEAAEQDGGGSESRPLRMVDPWEEGGWSEAEQLRLADPWDEGERQEAKPLRIVARGR